MSYGHGRGRGGFGGGFRPSKPAPVEVGKEYDVQITEISKRGDGIAKIEGFIIFVAGTEAGQNVKIRITDVAPRFAKAEVVE
ncbi:MAG: TRAM domain-containing protein [Thaumarchaeota archaeon]|nr:TRAM domain-containing protein [Nitrososphaerota archaeon]MCL5318804.1 TRAM domain-containing protein [Nitrososphaerota archaeon]